MILFKVNLKNITVQKFKCNALEHVPAKLHDFADKNMLQLIDLARFLFAQVIPPERKAR